MSNLSNKEKKRPDSEQNNSKPALYELDQNMKVLKDDNTGINWYSPMDAPFTVSGLAWFAKDRTYRRLPVNPDVSIPPAVSYLADCTSGGHVRFRTNSKEVYVRVKLKAPSSMYHMAPTGECGMDAYIGEPGKWIHAGTAKFTAGSLEYESRIFQADSTQVRSFMLNMPLYQGVEELHIGLEDGASVMPPLPYDSPSPVVLYGTSITQGGCASRPGMSYTNILSRRINLEFINLGFSGNGKGEPELAELCAQITNPACFVIDYEANSQGTENYRKSLPVFIKTYRQKHPDVPILLMSRITYGTEPLQSEVLEGRLERKQLQEELVRELNEAGDHRLYFFDGSELLGTDPGEATVDGVHPTDLGFKLMADGLEPVFRRILGI